MRRALSVLLLFLSVAACANDGAITGVGGTITPMQGHPSVRLVREKVDVRIGWESAKVRCEFVFKNEGPATTVKMGFPEEATGVDVGPIRSSDLKNFSSWVDGKPVKTTFVPTRPGPASPGETYRAWHVKNVSFKADQTRVVVDEYTSPLGQDSMGGRSFSYILMTGKSWKGKIGEAVVNLDASDVASFYEPQFSDALEGHVNKGGMIVWTAEDFEPSANVGLDLRPWGIWLGDPAESVHLQVDDPRLFGEQGVVMAMVRGLEWIEGCHVAWDEAASECAVTYGNRSLSMKPGDKSAFLDGEKIALPAAPYIKWSSLHAPVLTIAEKLGIMVERDDKTRSIHIGRPTGPGDARPRGTDV